MVLFLLLYKLQKPFIRFCVAKQKPVKYKEYFGLFTTDVTFCCRSYPVFEETTFHGYTIILNDIIKKEREREDEKPTVIVFCTYLCNRKY